MMKMKQGCIILLSEVVFICAGWGQPFSQDSPLGRNEHPRIFLNNQSLSEVVARAVASQAEMYRDLKTRADELLKTEPTHKGNSIIHFNRSVTLALVAVIEKRMGSLANPYMKKAFKYAQYDLENTSPWLLTSNHSASHLTGITSTLALIYDWLYEDLPGALKIRIHNFLVDVYKGLHNIDRPEGVSVSKRSVFGSRYWYQWGAHPWFAISLYGDNLGDEAIIEYALVDSKKEVNEYMVKMINMLGGALNNGWSYILEGEVSLLFTTLWAWQSATGNKVFSDTFMLKDFSKYFLYCIKPDGALIKIQDMADMYSDPAFQFGKGRYGTAPARAILILLMDIYKDNYARYVVDQNEFRVSGNDAANEGWRNLIFYDNTVQALEPQTLPLVRFFPAVGLLSARTGWGESDLFYSFRNSDQFGSHSDAKQNSFTIFYRGAPLAINDGNYPSGASGAQSTKSYYRRTLSSNSVLVFDPNETFQNYAPAANDGGQKFGDRSLGATGGFSGGWDVQIYDQDEFDASEYNTADNTFEESANYTYIKGDATRGYSAKVKQFIRDFVHLKPDLFVVFDRVGSSQSEFRKKWLIHSISEPLLNGSEVFDCTALIGESPCQGSPGAGISKSFNSDRIVITNGAGRLFVRTLLPRKSVFRKVGGPGYMFWVDDMNQDVPPIGYTPAVTGGWRVEISPQTPDDDNDGESLDYFLHVLYATDSSEERMPAVQNVSREANNAISGNIVGVVVHDKKENKVVIFNLDPVDDAAQSTISYMVETDRPSRHFVFGLKPHVLHHIQISGTRLGFPNVQSSQVGTVEFLNPETGSRLYTVSVPIPVAVTNDIPMPVGFSVEQNVPNPARRSTTINYTIENPAHVTIRIYNSLGQEIKTLVDDRHSAGSFNAKWDGKDRHGDEVAAGVYFYRLEMDGVATTRKMLKLGSQ